jgi:hypothetical protein
MFSEVFNIGDVEGSNTNIENLQAEFNRRNAIQNTNDKSYRLFLDQLYKYKYTIQKNQTEGTNSDL